MKYTIGVIVAVVIVAVGVLVYASLKTDKTDTSKNEIKKTDQQKAGIVDTPKKGIKRFTLTSKQAGIKGDGSITLKETLTSMAVRLVEAQAPAAGEDYEVYIVPKTGEPILAGPMIKVESPNEKYLWAGAGTTAWFEASKIIVTKRAKTAPKPGTIVAEAPLPDKAEPAQ